MAKPGAMTSDTLGAATSYKCRIKRRTVYNWAIETHLTSRLDYQRDMRRCTRIDKNGIWLGCQLPGYVRSEIHAIGREQFVVRAHLQAQWRQFGFIPCVEWSVLREVQCHHTYSFYVRVILYQVLETVDSVLIASNPDADEKWPVLSYPYIAAWGGF